MPLEFHVDDLNEIKVYKHATTTKIVLQDCYTTPLVIVIPNGDILDAFAHQIMMASLDAMDLAEGYLCQDIEP